MLSTLVGLARSAPAGGDGAASLLAYLDPGSGGVALQCAIAGMFSGLYLLRSSLARIRRWAARRAGRKSA